MTNFKVRIKFSNQQVYRYFYIVGWGKTWPAHSFPPPKCFDLSIYHLVFWLMLLLNCTCTILNGLFQRADQVFNLTSILVLLHCEVGKDWVCPFSPPPPPIKCFDVPFCLSVSWIILLFQHL